MEWREALHHLHACGWSADDIDEACEAIHEACEEGTYEGSDVAGLTSTQIRAVLKADLGDRVLRCIQAVAVLRRRVDEEGQALRRALYDLDAFAYEYVGND